MRRAMVWMLPGGSVLLLATVLAIVVEDTLLLEAVDRYHLVVYGVGLTLSAVFYRSRAFLALLGLTVFHIAVAPDPGSGDPFPLGSVYIALMGFLVLTRDRGMFSESGLLQLSAAVVFTGFITLLAQGLARAADAAPPVLPSAAQRLGLPPAMLLVGGLAVLATIYAVYRWRGPVERGFLWSQGLVLIALHPSMENGEASLFLTMAGLTLALSVLETTHQMAYRDELTGLPARRSLMLDLEDAAGGDVYTVAMVDVDHFKEFNDRHGHDVGDQVLKLVATYLAEAPGGAKAYRYGGEEFTLLFRGRKVQDALPHAEAVRAGVEEATFSLRSWPRPRKKPKGAAKLRKGKGREPRDLSVTVSVGLADSAGRDADPEDVLKEADRALYRAKERGRNRVEV